EISTGYDSQPAEKLTLNNIRYHTQFPTLLRLPTALPRRTYLPALNILSPHKYRSGRNSPMRHDSCARTASHSARCRDPVERIEIIKRDDPHRRQIVEQFDAS